MIKLQNIYKSFDSKKVIDNFSLEINQADFVCVVGPSGCGKSTLLKIIAGYETVDFGSVMMHNEPISKPSVNRAVISQEDALFPWYTVYENIAYGLKRSKMSKVEIDQKVLEILKDIDLVEDKNKKVFELSGGMKQRVSLAQVLVNEPELILLDEPLGALDTMTRKNMQYLIHDLWKTKGLSMMMITHDIEEALLLANKIYVFTSEGLKLYEPTFYKQDNYDKVYLMQEFISLKQEITNII